MLNPVAFDIISTGSQGNAVVLNDVVLIDCGVPYKALNKAVERLKLVLLTHIHTDHFKRSTVKRLALERPTLRFACCDWLVAPLLKCGVDKHRIDVLEANTTYNYSICQVTPVPLVHDVPNCGYKVIFADGGKVIYCTDTNTLDGITAKDFDLYLIEANYEDAEIQRRIIAKARAAEYVYEKRVIQTHLSKVQCDDFLCRNMGTGGEFIYMHQHKEANNE